MRREFRQMTPAQKDICAMDNFSADKRELFFLGQLICVFVPSPSLPRSLLCSWSVWYICLEVLGLLMESSVANLKAPDLLLQRGVPRTYMAFSYFSNLPLSLSAAPSLILCLSFSVFSLMLRPVSLRSWLAMDANSINDFLLELVDEIKDTESILLSSASLPTSL